MLRNFYVIVSTYVILLFQILYLAYYLIYSLLDLEFYNEDGFLSLNKTITFNQSILLIFLFLLSHTQLE